MRMVIYCVIGVAVLIVASTLLVLLKEEPMFVPFDGNPFHESEFVKRRALLIGRSLEDVVGQHGPADNELSFTAAEIGGEFQSHLLNHYPLSHRANRTVQFKELWWKRKNKTLTVWFHKKQDRWEALEAVEWTPNVSF
jgi:hypothetical protein